MAKLRPLNDKIIVKRLEAITKTAGGIVLPDTAKEKPKQGKIVAVGQGRMMKDGKRQKMQLKKGDLVIFTSYAGTEAKIEGDDVLIMSEEDVLAVIE